MRARSEAASSFLTNSSYYFLALFDETLHSLADLGARCLSEQLEAFVEARDLRFGLGEMSFEEFPQLVVARRLRHLGQRLRQLLLGMQHIAQLIDQQVVKARRGVRRRTLRYDRRRSTGIGVLQCRRRREDPIFSLVPRAAAVDFTLIAFSGGIVEVLIDKFWRRRDPADAERRLAHAFPERS